MSPETAKAKSVGDYIALRGIPDLTNFRHIGRVTKTTSRAFYAHFHNTRTASTRYCFNDAGHMAALRGPSPAEIAGYEGAAP